MTRCKGERRDKKQEILSERYSKELRWPKPVMVIEKMFRGIYKTFNKVLQKILSLISRLKDSIPLKKLNTCDLQVTMEYWFLVEIFEYIYLQVLFCVS